MKSLQVCGYILSNKHSYTDPENLSNNVYRVENVILIFCRIDETLCDCRPTAITVQRYTAEIKNGRSIKTSSSFLGFCIYRTAFSLISNH